MRIDAVRANGPAHESGVRIGDLLLGVHGWQTITQKDLGGILTLKNESTPAEPTKVKYYILRDGHARVGFMVPTKPLTRHRIIR